MNSVTKTKWIGLFGSAIGALMIASCGSSSETTNKVPSAADPNNPANTPLTTTPVTQDGRIPDISKAVAINLVDKINYTGLADLAQNVFPPVVGDAKITFALTGDRSTALNGKVLIAFEDSMGFWGAQLSSFDGTGIQSSGVVDIIFADDEFVVRVIGSTTSGILNGNIYYRLRVSSSETACKKRTVTCNTYYPPGYFGPPITGQCDTSVNTAQLASECRDYISAGNASVKQLGSFKGTYSTWLN